MSALAAYRLGFSVAILEKEQDSPAGQLTHHEFTGSVNDGALLRKFSKSCDVVTLENEFVDYRRLEFLEQRRIPVLPSSTTISLIQDKLLQKIILASNDIPVANFLEVNNRADYEQITRYLGSPFVLKSRKMGYDGYGNALISSKKQFEEAYTRLSARHPLLVAEMFIRFTMELAIMVVRTKKEIKTYPVVQTIQRNHICHTVIAPAPIGKKIIKNAEEIAVEAVRAVDGMGLFGVEMFLTHNEEILVNEMAPRPHNSGHYTIEGCATSQFENHIRAVMQLPLGSTKMVAPYAVMINLLGKRKTTLARNNYTNALQREDVHLHIYGKTESRPGRKMGHITLLGDTLQPLLRRAKTIESQIAL
jgi:5-(carboxyamino)imidazole ribonucleotide synthase